MAVIATSFKGLAPDSPVTIKSNGFTVTARVEFDEDHSPPWEEEDGHGPVSEWTRRAKNPGERILHEDRGAKRYYDFQEEKNRDRLPVLSKS